MPPAARMGDMTAHGGTIVAGAPTVLIGSLPAARWGDPHLCPSLVPSIHVGGLVTSSSTTVWIGGALAARVGDHCGCMSVGTVGAGVPAVVGRPARTSSTDPDGRTLDQLDAVQPAVGPHAETEVLDWDGDGSYDTARGGAGAAHMNNETCGDAGGFEFCAQHNLDAAFNDKSARVTTGDGGAGDGVGGRVTEEGALIKHGVGVSVGPSGRGGARPIWALRGEYKVLSAESELDVLVVDDGRRRGIGFFAKTEAQVLSGKLESENTYRIPFTDWTFGIRASAEGDAVALGGGVGAGAEYDTHEDRLHVRALVALEFVLGFELDVEISLGPEYPEIDWETVVKAAGAAAPNTIVTGAASVLIG